MNEIEKILKDNMEDYESVKRQALKSIHENKKELSKNYAYAEVCGNPVDASHFFFLIDEKKPGSDLLLEMLDYALKKYVSSEKASVTACIKGGFHLVKMCIRDSLIGDGELKEQIQEQAKKAGVLDKIIFTGVCQDVERYLSAMDVFLFPSLFEGLPFTLLEAQANGLPLSLIHI